MPNHHSDPRKANESPIARIRKERGLTQSQLAQLIGLPPPSVSRWERDAANIRISSLERLAKALDCSPYDLVSEENAQRVRDALEKKQRKEEPQKAAPPGVCTRARCPKLTNQRFGRLTALCLEKHRWRCKCDCGRECYAYGTHLVNGLVTECPTCRKAEEDLRSSPSKSCRSNSAMSARFVDLTGQRFGLLVAQSYNREICRWVCQCDCGNVRNYSVSMLRQGKRLSCGCTPREAIADTLKSNVNQDYVQVTNVSRIQALMHLPAHKNNKSGFNGVCVYQAKSGVRYRAQIHFKGKSIYLGTYKTFEEAVAARKAANQKYFQEAVDQSSDDTHGVKAYTHEQNQYYTATIYVSGLRIYLGTFQSRDAAVAARKAAEQKYWHEAADPPND